MSLKNQNRSVHPAAVKRSSKTSRSDYSLKDLPADNILHEPSVAYGSNAAVLKVAGKSESQMTSVEKMYVIRDGITKNSLELLKKKTGLGYDQLSEILGVARATLINKKGVARFNSSVSEKIVGLADLYSFGYEVFGDKDNFNEWMLQPNHALAGERPFDLLDNVYGRTEVRNLIGRISHGIYS